MRATLAISVLPVFLAAQAAVAAHIPFTVTESDSGIAGPLFPVGDPPVDEPAPPTASDAESLGVSAAVVPVSTASSNPAIHERSVDSDPPPLVWRIVDVAPLLSTPDLEDHAPVPRPGVSLRV